MPGAFEGRVTALFQQRGGQSIYGWVGRPRSVLRNFLRPRRRSRTCADVHDDVADSSTGLPDIWWLRGSCVCRTRSAPSFCNGGSAVASCRSPARQTRSLQREVQCHALALATRDVPISYELLDDHHHYFKQSNSIASQSDSSGKFNGTPVQEVAYMKPQRSVVRSTTTAMPSST